jgi:acyl carrier protein
VAYIVADRKTVLNAGELRSYLKEKLPEYMIPSTFVRLEALPLTPNGKVDRRSLPTPDQLRPEVTSSFVPPASPVEEMVAGLWSQILGVKQPGVYDNFFELGGHSLVASQLISKLRSLFQVEVSLQTFFEAPTIAALSRIIEQSNNCGAKSRRPALAATPRDRHLAEVSAEGVLTTSAGPNHSNSCEG